MDSLDQDLLARFAALKGGRAVEGEKEEKTAAPASTPSKNGADDTQSDLTDQDVDAYLASLEQDGGAEDGTLDYLVDSRPTERPETSLGEEIQKLLRESERLVGLQPTDPLHDHSHASTSMSDEEREDEDSHLNKEVAYRQALEEADILKAHEAEKGDSSTPSAPTDISTTTSIDPADPTALLAALSTPSNPPVLEQDLPDDPTFAKLLGLTPSAEAPTTKTPATPKGNAPKPLDIAGWRAARDNAVESWCSICSSDAELLCPGCDDDLYCRMCFQEGHSDESAEEMRRHRPRKYVWSS